MGKYRLIAELGRGGMADVYLAATAGPGGFSKLLVIKQLRVGDDPMLVTMFLDEAKLAARVNHPHVVQTFEVVHEADRAFMVMEFLDGPSLSRLRRAAARKHQQVPLAVELRIMRDALSGLHHAHELKNYDGQPLNVVHRDFTPQNLIITYDGDVKIVDFGIAKALDQQTKTSAGMFKGKLTYVPPEQLLGQPIDRRSDLFAAGIMLYEAITGDSPWKDMTNAAVTHALAQGNIPRLIEDRSAPPELAAICDQALAVDPDARYATAEELRLAIEEFVVDQHLELDRTQLSDYVTGLLGDAKERTRKVIEQQMKFAASLPSGETLTRTLPTLDGLTPSPPQKVVGRELLQLMESTATPDTGAGRLTDGPVTTLSPAAKGAFAVVGLLLLVLTAVVVWLVVRTSPTPPPVALAPQPVVVAPPVAVPVPVPEPAPSAAPRVEPVAPTTPPEPSKISVRVRATPAFARVYLDGTELEGNPFEGQLQRDAAVHQLRVVARGYEEVRREVQLDRDLVIELSLARLATPAKSPPRAPDDKAKPAPGVKAPAEADDSDYFPSTAPKKPAKRPLDTTIEF